MNCGMAIAFENHQGSRQAQPLRDPLLGRRWVCKHVRSDAQDWK